MATLLRACDPPVGYLEQVRPADGVHFTLAELQGFVGGNIETVPVFDRPSWLLVVNESGRMDGLPVNTVASALFHHDVLCGDVLLCPKSEVM